MSSEAPAQTSADYQGWKSLVAKYQTPDVKVSTWQLVNSFGGLFLCWVLMYFSLVYVGYWLTLLLAIPAAGFLVRIFIIQHDCGHGSFFKSRQRSRHHGHSLWRLYAGCLQVLAQAARHPSRPPRRAGGARHRRRVDDDGRRVPGRSLVEAHGLPHFPEPVLPLRIGPGCQLPGARAFPARCQARMAQWREGIRLVERRWPSSRWSQPCRCGSALTRCC